LSVNQADNGQNPPLRKRKYRDLERRIRGLKISQDMASWAFKYDLIQREYNTQDMTSWAFKYDIIQREYNNEMF
jgi:hypothetical protein